MSRMHPSPTTQLPPPPYECKNDHDQPCIPPVEGGEDAQEVLESLQWIPSTPYQPFRSPLPRLVAVPQIQPNSLISGPMPFLRAYAPALAPYDITPETFTAFIDGLAVAQAPAPPMQAVQLVGIGLGFVPYHWAQLASAGVGLAADAGTAAVSATRTKLYLEETNARLFQPRGLKVRIVGEEELQQLLHLPTRAPLLAPIDTDTDCLTLADRRLAALRQYLSPLTLDVPPPVASKNVIDRLSGKQVQMRLRKNRKRAEEASVKAQAKEEKRDKGAKKDEEDEECERKRAKRERKGAKRERKEEKHERKEAEKELKGVGKLKWIVVESL
ncbi:uncharacterized protein HMPREF1541_11086 [Cyphellophora europaea CBS 101466]|uniref:Uncharacterized protein n=1 Tax=Cyphellophora europaea (strain CBS 101466) TaxID=1220924 RepID=W2S4Z8_CYPE1|nr:uncharacterized protein HMPREF1541_11086 [Cyphellophora europaea CBS 101466]ETN43762.1 hypothetical protein HMPREF1541_11086 [Cyphellophora europaea CBS 101466]